MPTCVDWMRSSTADKKLIELMFAIIWNKEGVGRSGGMGTYN